MFDAQHVVEMTVRIDRQHRFEPVFGEETVECGIFFGVEFPASMTAHSFVSSQTT